MITNSSYSDRDKIIKMLTKVDDQFSLKIYRKAYNITDEEINNARKEFIE